MKFWEEAKKQYLKESNLKKEIKSIFDDFDEMLKLTVGVSFSKTSEEILNQKLEKIKDKMKLVKNKELMDLFERMYTVLEKRIEKKWEGKLIKLLKKLRKKKGLSQAELARKAGVSNGYIWRYEKGQRHNLSLSKLFVISKALEIDITWILSKAIKKKTNIKEKSTKLDKLIKNSIILKNNDKFYNIEEKDKLISFIEKINSIESEEEITFNTVNKVIKAFIEYKNK